MQQAESSRDTVQRRKKLPGPILGHILGPALGNDDQVLGRVLEDQVPGRVLEDQVAGPMISHILGPALGNDGQVLGRVMTLAKFLVMALALKIQSLFNV